MFLRRTRMVVAGYKIYAWAEVCSAVFFTLFMNTFSAHCPITMMRTSWYIRLEGQSVLWWYPSDKSNWASCLDVLIIFCKPPSVEAYLLKSKIPHLHAVAECDSHHAWNVSSYFTVSGCTFDMRITSNLCMYIHTFHIIFVFNTRNINPVNSS